MAITRQLGNAQDHVVKGSFQQDNEEYDYVAAMDGHGTGYNRDSCISLLRNLDFTIVAQQPNPVEFIRQQLLGHNLIHSGSTFTFARINKTKQQIEVINVGDSMTAVFKNDKLVYTTPIHCFQNPEEVERTKSLIREMRPSTTPKPVNDTDVYLIESNVGVWITGEVLVPTQSFGHNNITGLVPSNVVISYESEDKVRVICGTDGFWDMKMIDYPYIAVESAIRLVNVAERKWKQQWMYFDGKHNPVQTSFDEADDIGIAIWDK
uniref:PPM-type phosphatase domain-containing protein n=1 Tax=viral metagenome TaxID=1070528 RepID=A0A6C0B9T2_9ZZZZ